MSSHDVKELHALQLKIKFSPWDQTYKIIESLEPDEQF